MDKSEIQKCKKLLDEFISGKISAPKFEKRYIDLWGFWRDTNILYNEEFAEVFDTLFSDCDVYCASPELRDKYAIDEKQLLECVKIAQKKLELISK